MKKKAQLAEEKAERQYLRDNKSVYQFVKSRGWTIAKGRLMDQISDIQSIMNVDGKTADEVLIDVKVRKLLVEELLKWVKSVEGQAAQHEADGLQKEEEEIDHVIRFDEEE